MLYASLYKAKARAVLLQHWQTALLIALIVNLPLLLVQGIAAFTNSDPLTRLQTVLLEASSSAYGADAFTESLRALFQETGILAMSGLYVLAWLVTPALSLGMNHWTLDRIRGLEEPVSTVFSRLGIFLKGIGLRLLVALKVLLWMLPGIGVSALAVWWVSRADPSSEEALYSAMRTGIMVVYLGSLLMLVLGVMGYLRYALADLILADEPEERVFACARRSRELMAGRRGRLLSLLLSFILWHLLISVVATFTAGIAGDVIALMLQMLGGLLLSVYMLASQGVFYEALRSMPVQVQSVAP